jgi:putative membrane protein
MRLGALIALIAVIAPGAAHAHADGLPVGPNDLWHHWTLDPWVWTPLLLAHWLYGRGVLRAWARAGRGRIVECWRVGAFIAGEAMIIVALISPLDALGETLLSAHMTQHILLTTLAPLLLVLGNPARAWIWALPVRWRALARAALVRALVGLWRWLTRPMTAVLAHSVALWLWHTPALFDAALLDEGFHALEHLSFFGTALLFWSAMLRRTTAPAFAALLVVVMFVQSGLLGAVLTLAPLPLYAYGDRPMLWGLSAIEDQQIAGLLMWAPAGLVYMAPFAWFASQLFAQPQARGRLRESTGIMRASTSSRSMK